MSSSQAFKPSDSGLLLVFAEPGKDVTLDEFHDWYNNEHIPLRTERFPGFRSAARYEVQSTAASSTQPYTQSRWAAIYTIDSLALLFDDPDYTKLRTQRSAREAELLGRIAVLDRRIYRLTYDSDADAAYAGRSGSGDGDGGSAVRDSLRPVPAAAAPPVVIATSVTPAPDNQDAYDAWYLGEHVGALSAVPGWRRTRRFELVDALVGGRMAARENADAGTVPRCLGLHEYDSPAFASTPEFKAALDTPWRTRVMREDGSGIAQQERRVMHLYRAWEPTAALSSAAASGQEQ